MNQNASSYQKLWSLFRDKCLWLLHRYAIISSKFYGFQKLDILSAFPGSVIVHMFFISSNNSPISLFALSWRCVNTVNFVRAQWRRTKSIPTV